MGAPPVDNRTDFVASAQLLVDKESDQLVTMVKATFEVGEDGFADVAPKRRRRGLRFADIPWGDPEKSSILYPADLCVRKPPITDVVIVARAFAPGGKPVPSFDAAARVGPLQRLLRIFGPRVWQSGGSALSAARPIAELDVRYDYAFGGLDDSDPTRVVEEPRNPVGLGIARDPGTLTHRPAPSIEDPADPIKSARSRPTPAGIGAIGRHWEPRRRFVGTHDARWLEERAPRPPLDQDDRIHCCATPALVASPPLTGGEEVALLNLTPNGLARFALPRRAVEIQIKTPGQPPALVSPPIDTIVIDVLPKTPPEPITVEYVWRAALNAPAKLDDVRIVVREREMR